MISIAIVWLTKWLSRRYSKKLRKLPIPGELFLVIGGMYEPTLWTVKLFSYRALVHPFKGFTIFMTFYKYADKIETVGEIPSNLPKPQVRIPGTVCSPFVKPKLRLLRLKMLENLLIQSYQYL